MLKQRMRKLTDAELTEMTGVAGLHVVEGWTEPGTQALLKFENGTYGYYIYKSETWDFYDPYEKFGYPEEPGGQSPSRLADTD